MDIRMRFRGVIILRGGFGATPIRAAAPQGGVSKGRRM
jgi:hypothetical protein